MASVEKVDFGLVRAERAFFERLKCNRAILKNAYLYLDVLDDGHGEYIQVGREQVTSPDWCGRHTSYFLCHGEETEHHKGIVYGDVDYTGKNVVTQGHITCKNSGCPVCFLSGWGGRQLRAIVGKLNAGVAKGFGVVEAFTISFPESMWGLPLSVLRKRSEKALAVRGILGVALFPHGRRIDRRLMRLVWGVHFHAVGFVGGTYDICRDCPFFVVGKNRVWCSNPDKSCMGFEQRTRRAYDTDGIIVKVHEKRKTVEGTIKYLLSHCTKRIGIKREHIVTYWGVLANKRLKSFKLPVEVLCPVCASVGVRSVSVKSVYVGKESIVTGFGDPRYVGVLAFDELGGEGEPLFVEVVGGRVE